MNKNWLTHGRSNGLVLLGVGFLFLILHIILVQNEEASFRILMFGPPVFIAIGLSMVLFPGAKVTTKEVHSDNIDFWGVSSIFHRTMWIVFSVIGIAILVMQLLSFVGFMELDIQNCFLSKYIGLGYCD